ncbi:MAG: hypothetical protein KAH98_05445 [Dehalococcoidia bacterium]|nr:hypothetical protein [Dehalococcoidia bacterium]MCK5654564.1 hypothetical protein [Dehalococcoidia bacterium]
MARISRMVMLMMAVVALGIGIYFIVQGVTQTDLIESEMRIDQVTIGLDPAAVANGELVDSAGEARAAVDYMKEIRRELQLNYMVLLGGGDFDPTNLAHLSLAQGLGQALDTENYMSVSVLAFGVTQMFLYLGGFMIAMGIALGAISTALCKRKEA